MFTGYEAFKITGSSYQLTKCEINMKVGLQLPSFTVPEGDHAIAENLNKVAKMADTGGFYSMWVMDHYFQIVDLFGEKESNPMLEGYSVLNYLAGITKNVKLGTLVTGIIYREPAYLAKTVSSLDVLSNGRAYLGIGAAWYEDEAKGLGFEFPSMKDRFEMLEENLQIAHQMWDDGNNGAYEGKHFKLDKTLCQPQPLQDPHPPILIGGMGEQKTLKFVAKYADACNLFARAGLETLEHKLDVLKRHCEDLGRDFDEIEKTTLGTIHLAEDKMDADQVIDQFKEYANLGFDQAIVNLPNAYDLTPIEIFDDEIIPAVVDF